MDLIYILYDSINNTIFASQVWQLLLNLIKQDPDLKIILISFETQKIILNYQHPSIKIIIIQRYKYLGNFSLFWNYFKLHKKLSPLLINKKFKIIARGPFAGLIALKLNLPNITVQARGLAAQEYCYSDQSTFLLKNILNKLRVRQLFNLEKKIYTHPAITIECVSPALKKYLIQTYGTNINQVTIAKEDLPTHISLTNLATWRTDLRQKFNISINSLIYCYSGSSHSWQCPNLTINFFKIKLSQDLNSFLLILTPNISFFEKLITKNSIPKSNYLVLSIPHEEIYKYLAIADYGLLFRDPHVINWVSRPTKALEYQAANLKIIHNNTVDFLNNLVADSNTNS